MRNARRFSSPNPEQCQVLRRVARHCLLSCLQTLEPGDFARRERIEYPGTLAPRARAFPATSHSAPPRLSWQASMLQKWLVRLERRKRCLARALTAPGPEARQGVERDGFDLAAQLGLLFIPAAGFTGFWSLADGEAADFLRLLASASGPGQAARRGPSGSAYLKLLAAPVLWALVFTRMELHSTACPDPFAHAGASNDLFAALGRLADSPPSVCFAAAALAAVAGPPAARLWIEKARQQAHRHGARGFAAFFGQLGG